jgi:hypothetical protein
VIALLRYAFLKGLRDSSLFAFILIPMMFPVAALLGVTLGKGRLLYPLYMSPQFSPQQNATLAGQITTAVCLLFTVITAFWTFRSEIATRSVGSFLLAARPLTLSLALILFAAAIGLAGWIGGMAMIGVLTTAMPPHLALLALKVAAGTVAASALGTLVVTISPNPGMVLGAYLACIISIVWVEKSTSLSQLIGAVAVAIVCAGLASFFLERRCAT